MFRLAFPRSTATFFGSTSLSSTNTLSSAVNLSTRRTITTLKKQTQHLPNLNMNSSAPLLQLQQIRNAVTSDTGAFLPDPERPKLGLTGVTATVTFGLLLGATISKNIAAFLEENELFVPSDDDDDD